MTFKKWRSFRLSLEKTKRSKEMENECNEKAYLHQQWRHLFRAIASVRSLGTRSLDEIHSRQPHRPVSSLSAVDCWRNQHFPRWLRAISFHNLNPARKLVFFRGDFLVTYSRIFTSTTTLLSDPMSFYGVIMDATANRWCKEKIFGKEQLLYKIFFFFVSFLRTKFRTRFLTIFATPWSNSHIYASRNAQQSVYRLT